MNCAIIMFIVLFYLFDLSEVNDLCLVDFFCLFILCARVVLFILLHRSPQQVLFIGSLLESA